MAYSELMLDVHDSVATLTFNRPEAMNALGGALRDEFADAVEVLPNGPERTSRRSS